MDNRRYQGVPAQQVLRGMAKTAKKLHQVYTVH